MTMPPPARGVLVPGVTSAQRSGAELSLLSFLFSQSGSWRSICPSASLSMLSLHSRRGGGVVVGAGLGLGELLGVVVTVGRGVGVGVRDAVGVGVGVGVVDADALALPVGVALGWTEASYAAVS